MGLWEYRRRVAAAAGIMLVIVAGACWLAASLMPPAADCLRDSRNPYRFRDWARYLRGLRHAEDAALVVVISDSQGYAGELASRRSYCARLEALLNERQTAGFARWEVANLSIDGVTPIEYMALAAALRDVQPQWAISISGSADYRRANYTRGFSFPRTDLPHLLTRWQVARRLSADFWRRHGKVEDTLTAWCNRQMPLLRCRDFLWSWLDTRFPGAQKAFYAPRTTYRYWQLPGKPLAAALPDPFPQRGGERLDLTYDALSGIMLRDFLVEFGRIPAAHRLVVAAPLASDFADSHEAPWIANFRRDAAQFSAELGLPFHDLTLALPAADFINSNHMNGRNHQRLAEWLADYIAAAAEP